MNTIKFTAAMLCLTGLFETSFAQDLPPKGCSIEQDKMGRGENRQCSFRSNNDLSRLVIENRHGTLVAYVNFNASLRNHKTLVIRWDDEKAVTTAMTRSSDFEAMFFVGAHSAISKIARSKILMVESETYRRGTAVDTFIVSDGEAMVNYVLKRSSFSPAPGASPASSPDKLVQDLQTELNRRGFNTGSVDGYMGQQTQAAIMSAQKSLGLIITGLPSDSLLADLRKLPDGIPRSTTDRNQVDGGRNDGYGAQVRACLQAGVVFPRPQRSGPTNPAVVYRAQLHSDGRIADVKLTRGSGNPNFDRAVETGIRGCSPFPRPPSGSYPSYIDINYNMYD
jgi:TonB family protein